MEKLELRRAIEENDIDKIHKMIEHDSINVNANIGVSLWYTI